MVKVYQKLIRDRIPEIIRKNGAEPVIRILDEGEYKRSLFQKLNEEIQEFTGDESLEEFCDVLEVLEALKDVLGFSEDAILETKDKKQAENGGFKGRIFLEKVMEHEEL